MTSSAVLEPEIWNPATDTWKPMATSARPAATTTPRCCCPDGRILLAGSGRLDGSMMPNEQTAEIFSPPYLNKGARPRSPPRPTACATALLFTLTTPDIAKVAKVTRSCGQARSRTA